MGIENKQQTFDGNKHMGEYLLWFVEETIFDLKYQDWAGGRMEVHTYEDEYARNNLNFAYL